MPEAPEQLPAPPAGEHIHMPGPSLLPIVNALGVALAIVGLTISWVLVAIGVVIFLISTVIWVVKASREFSELPAEHH